VLTIVLQLVVVDVVDRVAERRPDNDQRRQRHFHRLQDGRRRRLRLPLPVDDEATEKFACVVLARFTSTVHFNLAVFVSWLVERCLHGNMLEPSTDRQLDAEFRRVF